MIDPNDLHRTLTNIYGLFGRSAPAVSIQRIILTQVGDYPAEFFEWAEQQFATMEKLPSNVSKALTDLWHEWRKANPQKVAREQRSCPDCSGPDGKPGSGFYVFQQDESGQWYKLFCACKCFHDTPPLQAVKWTRAEAAKLPGVTFMEDGFPSDDEDYLHYLKTGEHPLDRRARVKKRRSVALNRVAGRGIDSFAVDERRMRNLTETERADYAPVPSELAAPRTGVGEARG